MKKILLILVILALSYSISQAQTTLYDGWISFTSNFLGNNEYEYNYSWGASTTLSQVDIDNLFPYELGPYTRTFTGIGTADVGFEISWENPVDFLFMTYRGTHFGFDPNNKTHLYGGEFIDAWHVDDWISHRFLSFRTKGYTGKQNIGLNIDYFARYVGPSEAGGPFITVKAGTPLRVTGNFEPIPEPATLILLGSGLLGFAGAYRLKRRVTK